MSDSDASLHSALEPLWSALPRDQAMQALVVVEPVVDARGYVTKLMVNPVLASHPRHEALLAGLWLYVDDLEAAHQICQRHEGQPTFDYWHAILHRREGDFGNSRYWYRRAAAHELLRDQNRWRQTTTLLDEVEKVQGASTTDVSLAQRQRAEWWTLWEWCGR